MEGRGVGSLTCGALWLKTSRAIVASVSLTSFLLTDSMGDFAELDEDAYMRWEDVEGWDVARRAFSSLDASRRA